MFGFNTVTACSPRNFEVVRKHGAKNAFDCNDRKGIEKIAEAVPDLTYAFDCIGNETSSCQSGGIQRAVSREESFVQCVWERSSQKMCTRISK